MESVASKPLIDKSEGGKQTLTDNQKLVPVVKSLNANCNGVYQFCMNNLMHEKQETSTTSITAAMVMIRSRCFLRKEND